MQRSVKRKVNLTVSDSVLDQARKLLENQGSSLSQVVEDFLAKLVHDSETQSEGDWLDAFYEKHYPKNYREPTDQQIAKLLRTRVEKAN